MFDSLSINILNKSINCFECKYQLIGSALHTILLTFLWSVGSNNEAIDITVCGEVLRVA